VTPPTRTGVGIILLATLIVTIIAIAISAGGSP